MKKFVKSVLLFCSLSSIVYAQNNNVFFQQLIKEMNLNPKSPVPTLNKLLEEVNFGGTLNLKASNAVYTQPQNIAQTTTAIETRTDYGPCASAPSANCRKDFFIACASSYVEGETLPTQCGSFSTAEYNDLITYYTKNPKADVDDYFQSKNDFPLVQTAAYENSTPLQEVLNNKESQNESSGWGTWFGLSPTGKKDTLAGTAQYAGYTGFCNNQRNNPGCYNVYNPSTCIVSLPKSTMQQFYGSVSRDEMRKIIDSKPLVEVRNTANGKCTTAPLGDVGPGESTGKKIDMTGCVMGNIGGNGLIHTHIKPLQPGEVGCDGDKKEFPVGGFVEKVLTCNCGTGGKPVNPFQVVLISDPINRKRLKGVFVLPANRITPKEGQQILARYTTDGPKVCAYRPNPKTSMCETQTVGNSKNTYDYKIVAGSLIDFGLTQ